MFHSRLAPAFLAAGLLAVPGRADAPDLTHSFTIPGTETRLKFYGKVQVFGQVPTSTRYPVRQRHPHRRRDRRP